MTTSETNTLHLSGALDIYGAPEIRELLIQEIGTRNEIAVDLSQVDSCDTAGLQVLLAACRTAQQSGKSLQITNISEAMTRTGQSLGLNLAELTGSSRWDPNN